MCDFFLEVAEASLCDAAGLGLSRYVNVFVIVGFNYNLAERPHRKCCLMYLVPEEDPGSCSSSWEGSTVILPTRQEHKDSVGIVFIYTSASNQLVFRINNLLNMKSTFL